MKHPKRKEKTKMKTTTTKATVKKIGIMTVSARAASKKIGSTDSRFCAAIFLADDTRKTAGEFLAAKIEESVKAGKRPEALAIARLTRPFTRRTAAILAARDIADKYNYKLADTIVAEVEAAEKAEKPYIDKEVARAKERAEKSAAKKAKREAAKIAANEDEILRAAAAIQARRETASKAAA